MRNVVTMRLLCILDLINEFLAKLDVLNIRVIICIVVLCPHFMYRCPYKLQNSTGPRLADIGNRIFADKINEFLLSNDPSLGPVSTEKSIPTQGSLNWVIEILPIRYRHFILSDQPLTKAIFNLPGDH